MSSWVNMLVISIYDLSCDAGINVSPSLTFRAGKRLNLHGSPLRSSLSFSYIFLIICNLHHIWNNMDVVCKMEFAKNYS